MDLGIGAMFGSGIAGMFGAHDTNRTNSRIASARNAFEAAEAAKARNWSGVEAVRNRDFNADQALKAMQFSERMSSTAVQRRMQDMKKAGINPILAGKYDGSSPAGSMATGSQPGTAKANAHGYTAINRIQPILDNLHLALSLKKLEAESRKADSDAQVSANTANITSPASEFMKDAKDVYTTGKDAVKHFWDKGVNALSTGARDAKNNLETYVNETSKKIRKPTGISTKVKDTWRHQDKDGAWYSKHKDR